MELRDQINTLDKPEDVWPDDNKDSAYILMNDIDLGTHDQWIELGRGHLHPDENPAYFSKKTFLGNNRLIHGELTCQTKECGVFGFVQTSRLDRIFSAVNLFFDGDYISLHLNDKYSSSVGNIAGTLYSSIISNSEVVGNVQERIIEPRKDKTDRWLYVGGIVGYALNSILENDEFAGRISGTAYLTTDVGGIFGGLGVSAKAVNTIEHCTVSGNIDITLDKRCTITDSFEQSQSVNIGGICGYCRGHFANNAVYGHISGVGAVGGIVGMLYADSEVDNNYFAGTLTSHGGKASGIVASMLYEVSSYTKSFTTRISNNAFIGNILFDDSIENLTNFAGGVVTMVNGTESIGNRFIVINNLSVGNIINAQEASSIVGAFAVDYSNESQNSAYFTLRNNWTAIRYIQTENSNVLFRFDCPDNINCPSDIISVYNNFYLNNKFTQTTNLYTHNLGDTAFDGNYLFEFADYGGGVLKPNAFYNKTDSLLIDRLNSPSVYHTTWRNMLCKPFGEGEAIEELDGNHLLPIPNTLSPMNCEDAEATIQ